MYIKFFTVKALSDRMGKFLKKKSPANVIQSRCKSGSFRNSSITAIPSLVHNSPATVIQSRCTSGLFQNLSESIRIVSESIRIHQQPSFSPDAYQDCFRIHPQSSFSPDAYQDRFGIHQLSSISTNSYQNRSEYI